MTIGCVVMAAGAATRFGRDKLLQPLCGQPLITHALSALPKERFARIIAVTRKSAVAALCKEAGVPALLYGGGPQSETVRRGIGEMAGLDGCLFFPGDQPLCTAMSIEAMLKAFAEHPACVIRLAYGGRAGSPVLFPRALFGPLSALTGEQGGMAAAKKAGAPIRLVEALSPQELWDVDTPKALARLEAYLKQQGGAPKR